jgi:membrane protein implicated in regulation of membrane protease activity
MFLRHRGPDNSGGKGGPFGLLILGLGLIVAGGVLLGLGVIGTPLTSRPAFAAVLLPIAGIVCIIISAVMSSSAHRHMRRTSATDSVKHDPSER